MANEILNKIRVALGMEVSPTEKQTFAEVATLEDGTSVTADSFEVGKVLYIVDAEGNPTPATPDKQYMVNGMMITVDETGTITEVTDPAAPEAETPAEQMAAPEANPEIASLTEQLAQVLDVLNTLAEKVKALEDANTSASQAMASLQEKFSSIPAGKLITEKQVEVTTDKNQEKVERFKKLAELSRK